MKVVKHLKDIKVPDEMSRLMDYLNENVQSRVVFERIKSKEYLLKKLKPNPIMCPYGYFEPGAKAEHFAKVI